VGPEFIYTERRVVVGSSASGRDVNLKVFQLPLVAHFEAIRGQWPVLPIV
jgi:hypothetical protein